MKVCGCAPIVLCSFLLSGCVPASVESGDVLRFTRHDITDHQGFGYPVFQILVPQGWSFAGQVQWRNNMGLPHGVLTYEAASPDGRARVERFGEQVYLWSDNPTLMNGYQMNGAAVSPPLGCADLVSQVVLPFLGRAQATVTGATPMPDLAEQSRRLQEMLLMQVYHPISPLPARPRLEAEAALVDTVGGTTSERFLVVINRVYSAQPSMYGPIETVSWTAEITSYRAPVEGDPEFASAFQVMIRSAQISPRWAVDSTRLIATCARNMLRSQQQIFQTMRQIGQAQSEIGDMIMDGWQRRNAIMDGVHDRFSDAVRGSERYRDPIQEMEVAVPNLYENAWTNGLDYVFSENPEFDPNQTSSTQNWTQLQRVR